MEFTDLERLDAPTLPVPDLPWESIAGRLEHSPSPFSALTLV
jgi:hypothetical protein